MYPYTEDTPYLTSALLEPSVILERGVHYTITDGYITFNVDLFHDENIVDNVYQTGNRYMLLWAVDTVIQETFIYDRYGIHLYEQLEDGLATKILYTALQYFFTNQKNVKHTEFILNALLGMPYSRGSECTVEAISTDIITSVRTYALPDKAEVIVSVGEVVQPFTLLARVIKVDDYISDPEWYNGCSFPTKVIESVTVHLDSVYYETVYLDGSHLLNGTLFLNGLEDHWHENPNVIYKPVYLDGSLELKGTYTLAELEAANKLKTKLWMTNKSGDDTDKMLYNIMDNILKYNMFLIKYTVSDTAFSKTISELYELIHAGMPAHILYTEQIERHMDAPEETIPWELDDRADIQLFTFADEVITYTDIPIMYLSIYWTVAPAQNLINYNFPT
jgi:hypothetical protein